MSNSASLSPLLTSNFEGIRDFYPIITSYLDAKALYGLQLNLGILVKRAEKGNPTDPKVIEAKKCYEQAKVLLPLTRREILKRTPNINFYFPKAFVSYYLEYSKRIHPEVTLVLEKKEEKEKLYSIFKEQLPNPTDLTTATKKCAQILREKFPFLREKAITVIATNLAVCFGASLKSEDKVNLFQNQRPLIVSYRICAYLKNFLQTKAFIPYEIQEVLFKTFFSLDEETLSKYETLQGNLFCALWKESLKVLSIHTLQKPLILPYEIVSECLEESDKNLLSRSAINNLKQSEVASYREHIENKEKAQKLITYRTVSKIRHAFNKAFPLIETDGKLSTTGLSIRLAFLAILGFIGVNVALKYFKYSFSPGTLNNLDWALIRLDLIIQQGLFISFIERPKLFTSILVAILVLYYFVIFYMYHYSENDNKKRIEEINRLFRERFPGSAPPRA